VVDVVKEPFDVNIYNPRITPAILPGLPDGLVRTFVWPIPDQKLKEVSDFAEFLLKGIEDQILTEGIQKLVSDSKTFSFLDEEEDLYSTEDLKERYK
jgi:hypothetical protein